MRKVLTFTLIAFLAISCAKKQVGPKYTLEGKTGCSKGTAYLYGLDSRYEKKDSIAINGNGEFLHTIDTDTIMPLSLLMPDGKCITLYAEPNTKATVVADTAQANGWRVMGGGSIQALHDSISRIIDGCREQKEQIAVIDSFIKYNPTNELCITLLRRYMIEIPEPNNANIRSRISQLSGVLQDHEYITAIKKQVDQKHSNVLHKSLPSFTYTTAEGKEITASDCLKRYTLITFWASWNENSRKEVGKLRKLHNSIDSTYFTIVNISLDNDTAEWRRTITADSIAGLNVCDTKGFNAEILNGFNVASLPFSILVSPYQRINKYNVSIASDSAYIDSLVVKYRTEEKERERKKKKEKEKEKKNKKKIENRS